MATNSKLGRRGFLALAAVSAAAQTTSNPGGASSGQVGGMMITNSAWFNGPSVGGVAGQPYSTEQITEHVQTLADGTHITQGAQKTMMYRDSAGRTRTEHTFQPPPGATMASVPSMVQIMDPVAGYQCFLNQQNHTAQRMPWPPARRAANATTVGGITFNRRVNSAVPPTVQIPASVAPAGAAASTAPSGRPHPEIQKESLGTDTIEGLAVEGTRTTVTYPEGMMGNDRPITTVSETWFSQELKMVVLSKMSDPRNGDSTTRLTNISQSEPDPSLFQIPPDYQIIDQQQQQQ